MRFAQRVPAGDQRDNLFIVHRHAAERLPNVGGSRKRVVVAVGTFRIDIDQPHLYGSQRLFEVAFIVVPFVIGKPLGFGAPIDEISLPVVHATTSEAERLEAHRFQ